MSPLKFSLTVAAATALAVTVACAGWICWDIAMGWGQE